MDPREREYDLLEEQLMEAETEDERSLIRRELRDLERDMYEEQEWRDEGIGRGWL